MPYNERGEEGDREKMEGAREGKGDATTHIERYYSY
tara:strand:- start:235 stop:342 length:108 start_codon:yes stop_codon:yes gene_type:complete